MENYSIEKYFLSFLDDILKPISNLEIFNIIEEQISILFKGKLNILLKSNKQYLGYIFFHDGTVCYARYKNKNGVKGLFSLMFDSIENKEIDYVLEPEKINDLEKNISESYKEVKSKFIKELTYSLENQKLKPPEHLFLDINPKFIKQGKKLNYEQFDVLSSLNKLQNVKQIYLKSKLGNLKLTNILVELRSMGAITTAREKLE